LEKFFEKINSITILGTTGFSLCSDELLINFSFENEGETYAYACYYACYDEPNKQRSLLLRLKRKVALLL